MREPYASWKAFFVGYPASTIWLRSGIEALAERSRVGRTESKPTFLRRRSHGYVKMDVLYYICEVYKKLKDFKTSKMVISKNDYNMVACLMKHGADPFLKLNHTSPLEEAIQKCHIESLNEMIKLGNFDTIPETLASSSLFKAYNSGCSQAMDILKQQGVLERENGLVVYNSLVYRIFSKPGEKVCGDPIELMDLGFAFDDSFPIRHPDLISNESHKGKTISQILREEDLLEEEELIYLKEKRGVNVSPN